jgi:hypothetical protein
MRSIILLSIVVGSDDILLGVLYRFPILSIEYLR